MKVGHSVVFECFFEIINCHQEFSSLQLIESGAAFFCVRELFIIFAVSTTPFKLLYVLRTRVHWFLPWIEHSYQFNFLATLTTIASEALDYKALTWLKTSVLDKACSCYHEALFQVPC